MKDFRCLITRLLAPSTTLPTRKLVFLVLLLSSLLVSCVHTQQPPLEERLRIRMSSHAQGNESPVLLEKGKDTGRHTEIGKRVFNQVMPLKFQGAETSSASQKLPFSKTREVSVAVDEMPLPDFIHYIFSDIFQVNYVVDSKVKKSKEPITLNLNQEISEYQLFAIVVDVLKQHRLSVSFFQE
jgi:hypothetical protein